MRMTYFYIFSSHSKKKRKKNLLHLMEERMNEKKHSFPCKIFFSIFLYLRNNSAPENIFLNHQHRHKNRTDSKRLDLKANYSLLVIFIPTKYFSKQDDTLKLYIKIKATCYNWLVRVNYVLKIFLLRSLTFS